MIYPVRIREVYMVGKQGEMYFLMARAIEWHIYWISLRKSR